jgi:predicted transcriptional regulator
METEDSTREEVIGAFNAYTYWFMTLPDLSEELNLPIRVIEKQVESLAREKLMLKRENPKSFVHSLYTTKEHFQYMREHSLFTKSVEKALENPSYDWRTVPGLTKDLGLPGETVEEEVKLLISRGIVVSTPYNENGETLYTTRKHYKTTRPLSTKLISALRNEII